MALHLLKVYFVHLKSCFKYSRSQNTAPKNILLIRGVVWILDCAHSVQEASKQNIKCISEYEFVFSALIKLRYKYKCGLAGINYGKLGLGV